MTGKYKKKSLKNILEEFSTPKQKQDFIERLKAGELKTEGQFVNEDMNSARLLKAEYTEITRSIWDLYDFNPDVCSLSTCFDPEDNGESVQQKYVNIYVHMPVSENDEKNAGGRPRGIKQDVFNAEIAAYLYIDGSTDPLADNKKFLKEIQECVPCIVDYVAGGHLNDKEYKRISGSPDFEKTIKRYLDVFLKDYRKASEAIEKYKTQASIRD